MAVNGTKYVVLLGDGMADYPLQELGGKTPLQAANKKNMDHIAANGLTGMVKTIPENLPPGSDVANLSVLGYDPAVYYSGRSPFEAVSIGIKFSIEDASFRCNLVTLSDEADYESKTMLDHSSDEITTGEGKELLEYVGQKLGTDLIRFYSGISYRHCMIWKNGPVNFEPAPLTPPHDILGKKIGEYLPCDPNGKILLDLMKQSVKYLENHPVNISRRARGLKPANSIWLWGEGRKPSIPLFSKKYGIKGSVISAVDLVKGIGICAGLNVADVPGATGNLNTNFMGKAEMALSELDKGNDFIYIHIEAPDECGHRNEIANKVKAIELIDSLTLSTLLKGLKKYENYSLLLMPDHPTPIALRTHTSEAVPFAVYTKGVSRKSGVTGFDEVNARSTGLYIEHGHELMGMFIGGTL